MGRNNTKMTVAKIGQKVDDGFRVMEKALDELKEEVKNIQGCINDNEMAIVKLDTELAGHIKNHNNKKKRFSFSLLGR